MIFTIFVLGLGHRKIIEVCICCKSKAQLSARLQYKIYNSLIISVHYVLHWKVWGIIHWYKATYINCPRKYGILFCFRNAAFLAHFGNKMHKQDLINIT